MCSLTHIQHQQSNRFRFICIAFAQAHFEFPHQKLTHIDNVMKILFPFYSLNRGFLYTRNCCVNMCNVKVMLSFALAMEKVYHDRNRC